MLLSCSNNTSSWTSPRDETTRDHAPLLQRTAEATGPYFQREMQRRASWNLVVIGAAKKLATPVLGGVYSYKWMNPSGAGVRIYVFDTGIDISHPLFGGTAVNFKHYPSDEKTAFTDPPTDWTDTEGHGTMYDRSFFSQSGTIRRQRLIVML